MTFGHHDEIRRSIEQTNQKCIRRSETQRETQEIRESSSKDDAEGKTSLDKKKR